MDIVNKSWSKIFVPDEQETYSELHRYEECHWRFSYSEVLTMLRQVCLLCAYHHQHLQQIFVLSDANPEAALLNLFLQGILSCMPAYQKIKHESRSSKRNADTAASAPHKFRNIWNINKKIIQEDLQQTPYGIGTIRAS